MDSIEVYAVIGVDNDENSAFLAGEKTHLECLQLYTTAEEAEKYNDLESDEDTTHYVLKLSVNLESVLSCVNDSGDPGYFGDVVCLQVVKKL